MKKQLADDKLLKELRDSAFFRGRVSPAATKVKPTKSISGTNKKSTITQPPADPPSTTLKKSELATSPYFTPPKKRKRKNARKKLQTNRVTESVSNKVTELQTNRVTDYSDYDVPDYRQLKRVELRLTWEQNKYLDDLASVITRDMPEGERSNPEYKRITKNSILRALAEFARRLDPQVDAGKFRNERDLAQALADKIEESLADLQTNRVTESVSD
jgi:hypothetical protein